jgi:hypothetical protein
VQSVSRVEDVDYRKGSAKNNRIVFTATGQASSNCEAGHHVSDVAN